VGKEEGGKGVGGGEALNVKHVMVVVVRSFCLGHHLRPRPVFEDAGGFTEVVTSLTSPLITSLVLQFLSTTRSHSHASECFSQ
jgi:hypothetical protein